MASFTGFQEFPEGFPFPPSTGPTIPIEPNNPKSRQVAMDTGKAHTQALIALNNLSAANGGGLMGTAKGLISEYHRRGIITDDDRQRLLEVLESYRQINTEASKNRIQEIHKEAVADLSGSVIALRATAIADENIKAVAEKAYGDAFINGAATGVADFVGALVGSPAGPVTGFASATIASHVALHTHVTWNY